MQAKRRVHAPLSHEKALASLKKAAHFGAPVGAHGKEARPMRDMVKLGCASGHRPSVRSPRGMHGKAAIYAVHGANLGVSR